MKIHAHFYTTGDETPIFSMYDLTAIPFKVGEEIHLDVEELYPADYNQYKPEVSAKMIANNMEHRNLFNRKKIRIVSKGHYARFNNLREGTMTIEYHCEIIPEM